MTKYLDQSGLAHYDEKIKKYVNDKVGAIDLSLYKYVNALPTDIKSIETNKIYLVNSKSQGKENLYIEYIYTGTTGKTDTYDATKWEKLGEYKADIDLTPYLKVETFNAQKGTANGVATLDGSGKVTDAQLWDATEEKHGLLSVSDKVFIDSLPEDLGEDLTVNGKYENVVQFDSVYDPALIPTILPNSAAAPFKVVYVKKLNTFAALKDDKVFDNWPDGNSFGPSAGKGRAPEKKKLYVCTTDGLPYYYDGTTLQPCVGTITNGDIDGMFK